jgi:A/G-specific adenine glycosylase
MELGATICVPRKPLCLLCPLKRDCLGRARAEEFPVKTRVETIRREETVAIIRHGDSIYAEQAPEGKPWHGLWRFPDFDPTRMIEGEEIATIRYGITKYAVTMRAVEATWQRKRPNGVGVYLNAIELAARAFAAPHRKVISRLPPGI